MVNVTIRLAIIATFFFILCDRSMGSDYNSKCYLLSYLNAEESEYVESLQKSDASTTYSIAMKNLRSANYDLTTRTWALLKDSRYASSIIKNCSDTRMFSAILALSGQVAADNEITVNASGRNIKPQVMLSMAWQVSCCNDPDLLEEIIHLNSLLLYGNYLNVLLKMPDQSEKFGYSGDQLQQKLSQVEKLSNNILRGTEKQ